MDFEQLQNHFDKYDKHADEVNRKVSSDIWNKHFKAIYYNHTDPGDDADTVEDTEFFDGKEDEEEE